MTIPAKQRTASPSVPSRADRYLARKLLELTGSPQVRIQLWDGSIVGEKIENSLATLRFNNRSAFREVLFNRHKPTAHPSSATPISLTSSAVYCRN